MSSNLPVDPRVLREEVRSKYRDVATNPGGSFHFHTGRPLAKLLGYDPARVDAMPDDAVESFAGVANLFSMHALRPGGRLLFADIANGNPVPGSALANVDLWTA